jgi:hypothetical protein
MAPKVVRDGLNEAIAESAVSVFRIIGVESEALVAEYLNAADPLYRAGRAAPKRSAGVGLDHLSVEGRVHVGRDTEVGQTVSDGDVGLDVGDDDISGEDRLDLMFLSDSLECVTIEAGLADIGKDVGPSTELNDAHEFLVAPYGIHEPVGQEGPQLTLAGAVELDHTDDFVLFQVNSRRSKDSLSATLDCQCQQYDCDQPELSSHARTPSESRCRFGPFIGLIHFIG